MLLTVEYGDEVVEINCDQDGLAMLISKLQNLQQHGGPLSPDDSFLGWNGTH
jgi:hypothetical protein